MIIAEAGQNGCGSMELNKKLIELAKKNGADLVKFQLFSPEKLYKPDFPLFKEVKQAELTFDMAKELFDYGWDDVGIEVFFSVFDVERVKWCEEIGVKRYKVAYSQRNNTELKVELGKLDKQIILSTNGTFEAVADKYLYCVPKYPASIKDIDFTRLDTFDGFSDHTIGLDCAKIALARGCEIIEKHFAIDHNTGVDAKWSMTPDELAELKRWENICKEVL